MGEVVNIFKVSCRKATELIEKKTVTALSFSDQMQLFVHSIVCDGCRQYAKQSKALDLLFKNQLKRAPNVKGSLQLDQSVKERIRKELEGE